MKRLQYGHMIQEEGAFGDGTGKELDFVGMSKKQERKRQVWLKQEGREVYKNVARSPAQRFIVKPIAVKITCSNIVYSFSTPVSPTVCNAAGTWAPNKEHERMIQSTERKMLRLIIQTKRKYKKIEKQDIGPKEENGKVDITEMCNTDDESGDGQSTMTQNDVDSEVSFEDDADEEIDTTVIEEEDWIEYIKRSTEDAMEKMAHAKIRCWNRTHKKMKLAQRKATSPSE